MVSRIKLSHPCKALRTSWAQSGFLNTKRVAKLPGGRNTEQEQKSLRRTLGRKSRATERMESVPAPNTKPDRW